MLDIASQSFRPVTATTRLGQGMLQDPSTDPGHITFTPDDQHLLCVWTLFEDAWPACGGRYDVHDLTGDLVCRFFVPEVLEAPTAPAHVPGNRVAISFGSAFGLWDLSSGSLLGTRRPLFKDVSLKEEHETYEYNGVVAANRSGTRLAFCITWPPEIFVYSTVGLRTHDCFLAESRHCMPEALPKLHFPSMWWGVYGWIFWRPTGTGRELHVLRPHSRGRHYSPGLLCCLKDGHLPAFSPSGAFVASFQLQDACIKIYDTRTGQLKTKQAMRLPPSAAQADKTQRLRALVRWSSCGQRILVRLVTMQHTKETDECNSWEHLMVVRL